MKLEKSLISIERSVTEEERLESVEESEKEEDEDEDDEEEAEAREKEEEWSEFDGEQRGCRRWIRV